MDRSSRRFWIAAVGGTILLGAVVAPYFLFDIIALTAIALLVSQQFLKGAEWPDWFPGRRLTVRSRVMNYSEFRRTKNLGLNPRLGANPFEQAVIQRGDPLSLSDAELKEMRSVQVE